MVVQESNVFIATVKTKGFWYFKYFYKDKVCSTGNCSLSLFTMKVNPNRFSSLCYADQIRQNT